jgi:hypothetical protein
VWIFKEANGASFSEVHYRDASTAADAAKIAGTMLQARLGLLAVQHRFMMIRTSQVDANRVTGQNIINLYGKAKLADNFGDPVVAGVSAVLTLVGATSGSRKLWMRGCPDGFIDLSAESGQDTPTPTFLSKLTPYFKQLAAEGYGLRRLKGQVPGPLENKKIITLDRDAGFPFPGRVIIGGASRKDLPGLNGRWQLIAAPAGPVFKVGYQTPQNSEVDGGNGKARQESYDAVNVYVPDQCGFAYYGTRDTRNPTTASRGARRAQRLRTSL